MFDLKVQVVVFVVVVFWCWAELNLFFRFSIGSRNLFLGEFTKGILGDDCNVFITLTHFFFFVIIKGKVTLGDLQRASKFAKYFWYSGWHSSKIPFSFVQTTSD